MSNLKTQHDGCLWMNPHFQIYDIAWKAFVEHSPRIPIFARVVGRVAIYVCDVHILEHNVVHPIVFFWSVFFNEACVFSGIQIFAHISSWQAPELSSKNQLLLLSLGYKSSSPLGDDCCRPERVLGQIFN